MLTCNLQRGPILLLAQFDDGLYLLVAQVLAVALLIIQAWALLGRCLLLELLLLEAIWVVVRLRVLMSFSGSLNVLV